MKIVHQFLDTLTSGDAIGNYTLQIHEFLERKGITSYIYANYSTIKKPYIKQFVDETDFPEGTGLIFHHSTYTTFKQYLPKIKAKTVILYHNITPAAYFKKYNYDHFRIFHESSRQNGFLKTIDFAGIIGDSQYNIECIRPFIKKNTPAEVMPPFLHIPVSKKNPNHSLLKSLKDGKFNILCVARVAPNKSQPDLIKIFEYYQKFMNPQSRLVLAGPFSAEESYYQSIVNYIQERKLNNVIISGKISEEDLVAYYRSADCFVTMSEHEGFCIPILEAIYQNIPVFAYDIPALRELLNEAYLFKTKNFPQIARVIDTLRTNPELREKIIKDQNLVLANFQEKKLHDRLLKIMKKFFSI